MHRQVRKNDVGKRGFRLSKIRRMPSRCCHSAGRRKNTGDRATKSRPWITNRTDIPCGKCFLAFLRDSAERNSLYSPLWFSLSCRRSCCTGPPCHRVKALLAKVSLPYHGYLRERSLIIYVWNHWLFGGGIRPGKAAAWAGKPGIPRL